MLKGVPFVSTTTNKPALQEPVGDDVEIHEVPVTPYDVDDLAAAVERAHERRDA